MLTHLRLSPQIPVGSPQPHTGSQIPHKGERAAEMAEMNFSTSSLLFQLAPGQVQQVEGDAVERIGIDGWFDEGHQGGDHGGDTTQPVELLPKGTTELRVSISASRVRSAAGKGWCWLLPEKGSHPPAPPTCLHITVLRLCRSPGRKAGIYFMFLKNCPRNCFAKSPGRSRTEHRMTRAPPRRCQSQAWSCAEGRAAELLSQQRGQGLQQRGFGLTEQQ